MAALSNPRTLLPLDYPLSSLSWSDAAAAAAVGYNYPSSGSSTAHHLVYGGGRLVNGSYPYTCPPGGGSLGAGESSCSMYTSWHHPSHTPLSLYYQPEADWILRQSKLKSQPHPFTHHHHHPGQRWKTTSESARREVMDATSTNRPGSNGYQFDSTVTTDNSVSVGLTDNASLDGSSGGCAAGLSPVMDVWTTAGRSPLTAVEYRCRGQGLPDTQVAPSQAGRPVYIRLCH